MRGSGCKGGNRRIPTFLSALSRICFFLPCASCCFWTRKKGSHESESNISGPSNSPKSGCVSNRLARWESAYSTMRWSTREVRLKNLGTNVIYTSTQGEANGLFSQTKPPKICEGHRQHPTKNSTGSGFKRKSEVAKTCEQIQTRSANWQEKAACSSYITGIVQPITGSVG